MSDEEKKILLAEKVRASPSLELRHKVEALIARRLESGATSQQGTDPKSFGNSWEWAGVQAYPSIVALTEDVVRAGRSPGGLLTSPWAAEATGARLIGCGILIVALLLVFVGAFAVFFLRR